MAPQILNGTTFEHEYARPGIYEVTLRIVRGERLHEYLCEIAVARDVLLERGGTMTAASG